MSTVQRIIHLFSRKYALFAGHPYYPDGGACDFRAFGTVEGLKNLYAAKADEWSLESSGYAEPWGQIVDVATMNVLYEANLHVWSPLPKGQKPTSQHA
jgi:hypothetical protein